MKLFLHGHATHPDWRVALGLCAAQVEAQRAAAACEPTLGWVYLTDHYAPHAAALVAALGEHWPGVQWVGATGVGVAANGVEYFDEPALVLMLADLPQSSFRVFSGVRPLGAGQPAFVAHTALVHADPSTGELAGLIHELSERVATGYLFGGLAASRTTPWHIAGGLLEGGLSGVAFDAGVGLVSRVTQGCQPVGPAREITRAERNEVLELDGEPALAVLLRDLAIDGDDLRAALPRLRRTLVGLGDGGDDLLSRGRQFGADTRVRHLIGLDPARGGIAVADLVEPGMRLAFCARDTEAARRDLVRICAEIREELEPEALPLRDRAGAAGRRHRQRAASGAAHRRRRLRQLLGPRRAALRRAVGRAGDPAPRAGRRAAGGLLRRRRDRAPSHLRLHRRPHRLHGRGRHALARCRRAAAIRGAGSRVIRVPRPEENLRERVRIRVSTSAAGGEPCKIRPLRRSSAPATRHASRRGGGQDDTSQEETTHTPRTEEKQQ